MTPGGCPHCGAPYRKTVSADEDTLGELAFPGEEYAAVCYNVRAQAEAYLGFTLYFHPATVHAVETRPENATDPEEDERTDRVSEWSREDVYASMATARSHRDRLSRRENVAARIRDLPLSHARLLPENRPREPLS